MTAICDQGVDWAAWAQAVLSALGIVVGAYIAAKVAGRPVLTERHQKLSALLCLVSYSRDVFDAAAKEADAFDAGGLVVTFDLTIFDRVGASLAAVPPLEVSPGILLEGLIQLSENLVIARAEMADLIVNSPTGIGVHGRGEFFRSCYGHAEELRGAMIVQAIKAARAEKRWWWPVA